MTSRELFNGILADHAAAQLAVAVPAHADWYERRDELRPGMVFRDYEGNLVKLDRDVPGDATKWYVATWWNGSWAWMDSTIEPGDLRGEPLADPAERAA